MDALGLQPVDVMNSASAALTPTVTAKKGGMSLGDMKKASKDFESVFMAQMLKPMWEGVETDSMFGGGAGEDVMREMLVQEYGKSMAKADNYGLSDAVMAAMIRAQGQASAAAAVQG